MRKAGDSKLSKDGSKPEIMALEEKLTMVEVEARKEREALAVQLEETQSSLKEAMGQLDSMQQREAPLSREDRGGRVEKGELSEEESHWKQVAVELAGKLEVAVELAGKLENVQSQLQDSQRVAELERDSRFEGSLQEEGQDLDMEAIAMAGLSGKPSHVPMPLLEVAEATLALSEARVECDAIMSKAHSLHASHRQGGFDRQDSEYPHLAGGIEGTESSKARMGKSPIQRPKRAGSSHAPSEEETLLIQQLASSTAPENAPERLMAIWEGKKAKNKSRRSSKSSPTRERQRRDEAPVTREPLELDNFSRKEARIALRKLFKKYSRMAYNRGASFEEISKASATMDISEFLRFASEQGFVTTLTRSKVKTLFHKVKWMQLQKEKGLGRQGQAPDNGQSLSIDEFVEAVQALCEEMKEYYKSHDSPSEAMLLLIGLAESAGKNKRRGKTNNGRGTSPPRAPSPTRKAALAVAIKAALQGLGPRGTGRWSLDEIASVPVIRTGHSGAVQEFAAWLEPAFSRFDLDSMYELDADQLDDAITEFTGSRLQQLKSPLPKAGSLEQQGYKEPTISYACHQASGGHDRGGHFVGRMPPTVPEEQAYVDFDFKKSLRKGGTSPAKTRSRSRSPNRLYNANPEPLSPRGHVPKETPELLRLKREEEARKKAEKDLSEKEEAWEKASIASQERTRELETERAKMKAFHEHEALKKSEARAKEVGSSSSAILVAKQGQGTVTLASRLQDKAREEGYRARSKTDGAVAVRRMSGGVSIGAAFKHSGNTQQEAKESQQWDEPGDFSALGVESTSNSIAATLGSGAASTPHEGLHHAPHEAQKKDPRALLDRDRERAERKKVEERARAEEEAREKLVAKEMAERERVEKELRERVNTLEKEKEDERGRFEEKMEKEAKEREEAVQEKAYREAEKSLATEEERQLIARQLTPLMLPSSMPPPPPEELPRRRSIVPGGGILRSRRGSVQTSEITGPPYVKPDKSEEAQLNLLDPQTTAKLLHEAYERGQAAALSSPPSVQPSSEVLSNPVEEEEERERKVIDTSQERLQEEAEARRWAEAEFEAESKRRQLAEMKLVAMQEAARVFAETQMLQREQEDVRRGQEREQEEERRRQEEERRQQRAQQRKKEAKMRLQLSEEARTAQRREETPPERVILVSPTNSVPVWQGMPQGMQQTVLMSPTQFQQPPMQPPMQQYQAQYPPSVEQVPPSNQTLPELPHEGDWKRPVVPEETPFAEQISDEEAAAASAQLKQLADETRSRMEAADREAAVIGNSLREEVEAAEAAANAFKEKRAQLLAEEAEAKAARLKKEEAMRLRAAEADRQRETEAEALEQDMSRIEAARKMLDTSRESKSLDDEALDIAQMTNEAHETPKGPMTKSHDLDNMKLDQTDQEPKDKGPARELVLVAQELYELYELEEEHFIDVYGFLAFCELMDPAITPTKARIMFVENARAVNGQLSPEAFCTWMCTEHVHFLHSWANAGL